MPSIPPHITYYNNSDKVQAYIDKDQKSYDLRNHVLKKFLEGFPADGRLLDIGCGYGYDVHQLRQKGYDAYGVDQSASMISKATELFGPYFKTTSLFDLKHIDETYDIVISRNVLVHVETHDLKEALENIYSAIKPGGHGIISSKQGTGISITHTTGSKRETRLHDMLDVAEIIRDIGGIEIEPPFVLELPSTNKDPLFGIRIRKPE